MLVSVTAKSLLDQAATLFDDELKGLAREAPQAWRDGFASGGQWMHRSLEILRGKSLPMPARKFNVLGSIKYCLAIGAALVPVIAGLVFHWHFLVVLAVPAFYAVEVQMVFLFPVVIDGSRYAFRESRQWTVRAGGTLAVMRVVLALATTMLFGGFVGRGFVRSWCLGCLAVCIWYESLRQACIRSCSTLENNESTAVEVRSVH